MAAKLQQCLEMMAYLGKTTQKYACTKHDTPAYQVSDLLAIEHRPYTYWTFTLSNDGAVSYTVANNYADKIAVFGLLPSNALLDIFSRALTRLCLNKATDAVKQRLLNHELTYAGLEFLTKDPICHSANQLH